MIQYLQVTTDNRNVKISENIFVRSLKKSADLLTEVRDFLSGTADGNPLNSASPACSAAAQIRKKINFLMISLS